MSLIPGTDSITPILGVLFVLFVVIVLVQLYRTNRKMAAKLGVEPTGLLDFNSNKKKGRLSITDKVVIGGLILVLSIILLFIGLDTYFLGDQVVTVVFLAISAIGFLIAASFLYSVVESKNLARIPPPPEAIELDTKKTPTDTKSENRLNEKSELKKKTNMSEHQKSAVYCSSCGNENDADAVFCENCGAKIRELSEFSTEIYCNLCGTKNSKKAKYCKKCGKNLPSTK